MALISPGVQVSVIDESQYISAAANSTPLIVIATAENKSVPSGDSIAPGTQAGSADSVYLITSQRDLVNTFGNPFFYRTTSGTPIHGYELNEYGLLAAYSVLGVSNRAYIVRADVDLTALTARLSRPVGEPADGLYWLDLAETEWGIFEWNRVTGLFTNKQPIVIEDENETDSGLPLDTIGVAGSYAVVATNAANPVYYKNSASEWVLVGSPEWVSSIPVLKSGSADAGIKAGSFTINGTSIAVNNPTLAGVVDVVNNPGIAGLRAEIVNNKIEFYVDPTNGPDSLDFQNVSSGTLLEEIGIEPGVYYIPKFQQSSHTQVPRWRSSDTEPRPTGSVWHKTSAVNEGADLVVRRYVSAEGRFVQENVRVYKNDAEANRMFDPAGGGQAIPAGTLYARLDVNTNNTATVALMYKLRAGITQVSGLNPTPAFAPGDAFVVRASDRSTAEWQGPYTVPVNGVDKVAFVTALNSANIPNVSASIAPTGVIQIQHALGGAILVESAAGDVFGSTGVGLSAAISGVREEGNGYIISNWVDLVYSASSSAPDSRPANGALWNYSAANEVDIMVNNGGQWMGYRTVENDIRGFDLRATDPAGVIVSALVPSQQPTTGAPLALGELWLDTSDLENYPLINRWEVVDGVPQWVKLDNTDQTTYNGIVFADARWSADGSKDPINDPLPSIAELALYSEVDPDAPNAALYPDGTLLFNTRRSGFNVKRLVRNYFNPTAFPDVNLVGRSADAWVTAAGNRDDGSPYSGRHAARAIVVAAMKAALDTNQNIREEKNTFNLIACPGYPEVIPNMVSLNNERKQTGFVVGDAPMRLSDSGNDIVGWSTSGTQDSLTSNDPYSAVFYPSCRTNDLTGNPVVQPASHMMLRTIIRSDAVAYPWLAPAGTRRGVVDNAQSLGYIDAASGEFVEVANRERVRDVLYENRINPFTFIPGAGIVNYGNKTLSAESALNRINVARLVAYTRSRLEAIGRQYLFEPNDPLTRNEIKGQVEQLMNELIAKRAIYDYLVVCDESNNTPARIDRNELWLDVAIEPVKAVEFVYIPIRIKNTGEIDAN